MQNKFSNEEIALLLRQVAAAYAIKNFNRFRIIAYEKAADTIEQSNVSVKDLWEQGNLSELPGVGKGIASDIDELFKTGKVKHFLEAFRGLPAGMFPLLRIHGFGPKKAYKLSLQFKLNSEETVINDLLKLAKSGKIANLEGFGAKSQDEIIKGLESFKMTKNKPNRMPLPFAGRMAKEVIDYIKEHHEAIEVYPLGSLRRKVSTIGDIDLAVSTKKPGEIKEWFLNYPQKAKLVETGPSGATILLNSGAQVDLRVQNPESLGAMLQYFTGSKSHNIHLRELALKRGLSLSEYGIKKIKDIDNPLLTAKNYNKARKLYEFADEKSFYKALGLPYIPPEMRENNGEIEAAQKNTLPKLVQMNQIKGEVHVHSDYDLSSSHDTGSSSLKELLLKAQDLGYEYLGISDHNPSITNHSDDDIIAIMKRRKSYFEQIIKSNESVRVKLFIMLEVDILPTGQLALPDKAFEFVDAVIVSVHSSFSMDKEKMTDRILKGLSHPKARILAHPTGRLIGRREGYEIDWPRLFEFCHNNNKALEINSSPQRLDLADIMVKLALENKVKLIINTDSHQKDQMNLLEYGIANARRGWATQSDILNTLSFSNFKKWLIG